MRSSPVAAAGGGGPFDVAAPRLEHQRRPAAGERSKKRALQVSDAHTRMRRLVHAEHPSGVARDQAEGVRRRISGGGGAQCDRAVVRAHRLLARHGGRDLAGDHRERGVGHRPPGEHRRHARVDRLAQLPRPHRRRVRDDRRRAQQAGGDEPLGQVLDGDERLHATAPALAQRVREVECGPPAEPVPPGRAALEREDEVLGQVHNHMIAGMEVTRKHITVVTGGARGIGAAICTRLARRPRHRLRLSLAEEARGGRRRGCGPRGGCTRSRWTRRPGWVDALFDAAAELGTVTGLVNNAGIVGPWESSSTCRRRPAGVFAVNVVGVLLCSRRAARDMPSARRRDRQHLLGAATLGAPGEYVHYAASKAAVDAITIGLAKELGPDGIRVNAVAPGVDLDRDPRRPGAPGQAGAAASRSAAPASPRRSPARSRGCSATTRPTPPARSCASPAASSVASRKLAWRERARSSWLGPLVIPAHTGCTGGIAGGRQARRDAR